MGNSIHKEVFTLKEASKKLGVKVRTLREWIKNGKIDAFKYRNSHIWLIREAEIDRMLNDVLSN